MADPLKTYAQAAEWLGVPVSWLQEKVQKREVPHTRLGKHVRFAQHHLDEIVRAGESAAPAPTPTAALTDLKPVGRRRRKAS